MIVATHSIIGVLLLGSVTNKRLLKVRNKLIRATAHGRAHGSGTRAEAGICLTVTVDIPVRNSVARRRFDGARLARADVGRLGRVHRTGIGVSGDVLGVTNIRKVRNGVVRRRRRSGRLTSASNPVLPAVIPLFPAFAVVLVKMERPLNGLKPITLNHVEVTDGDASGLVPRFVGESVVIVKLVGKQQGNN